MEIYEMKQGLSTSLKKLKDLGDSLWLIKAWRKNKRIRASTKFRYFLERPKESSKYYQRI